MIQNYTLLTWLLLAFFPVALSAQNITPPEPERPNIVWLVSEDNSANWLKLYNKNGVPMPNIERLAEQGLVFNNAFSCGAVCSVARSTIISGCYAPRVGAQYHRRLEPVEMPSGLKMFPYYLRQAGYYTTNCDKKDYNFKADLEEVWDESSKTATYRNRAPGQPFFHVQNYFSTHESRMHPNSKESVSSTIDPYSVELFPYHPDTKTFREAYARYMDLHKKVDAKMGEFIDQLEKEGLLNDTFIFYYGDHGGVLPRGKGYIYESGLQIPMIVYIPEKWKHLAPTEPGNRIDGFVQFIDLSATVINLAGAEIPEGIDGKPFLGKGVLLEELNTRDTAFGYADRFDEKYDLVRSLRKGRFKYIRNYQPFNFDGLHNAYRYKMLAYQEWRDLYREGKLSAEQSQFFEPRPAECLYDLEKDPYEINNLAGDLAYANKLVEMREQLQSQVKSMPDLSFIPEPVFLEQGCNNPSQFAKEHKQEIEKLIDIADLSLKAFPEAEQQIGRALESENPWERYWGLITCSSFGEQASPFYSKAKDIAESDETLLVRVRAAEFLGLTRLDDPTPVIMDALRKTKDPKEANLILNSVVLLRDSKPGYAFNINEFKSRPWAKGWKGSLVSQRLKYLQE
ncbi:MAG TPA: sulfatase [Pontiella sp.]